MKNYRYWGYGLAMAAILFLLKQLEYRYTLRELSTEILVGVVATIFMGMGYWVSHQMGPKSNVVTTAVTHPVSSTDDIQTQLEKLHISAREYEILQLLALGHSNQEIANQLYISLNTVKTHLSNLYDKLDVRRRTQAVQAGQQLGIL